MHTIPYVNRKVFLLCMVQILQVGLSDLTIYLKLLKSRFGQTLSLFYFYRLAPNRIMKIL